MSRDNFEAVMEVVFAHEGGYVDHPRDPGGATNWGITHLTLAKARGVERVSKAEVKRLTKEEAREIYRRYYWTPLSGDDLPPGYDLTAMDGGVNSGVSRGAKWVQRGVSVNADGKIGPQTLLAIRAAGVDGIVRACAARMSFLRGLRHWSTFGRGWSRRVAETEAKSVSMYTNGNKFTLEKQRDASTSLAKRETAAGTAQGTAISGGGVLSVGELQISPWLVAAGLVIVIGLIAFRSYRRAAFQADREEAYANELEAVK